MGPFAMANIVVGGATLRCQQGTSPATLTVAAPHGVAGQKRQVATVDDHQPMANIGSFGMCQSMANPQVSAATAAANGVLTPQPCVPVIASPWQPGQAGVRLQRATALTDDSTCNCQWGGIIEVTDTGDGGARL